MFVFRLSQRYVEITRIVMDLRVMESASHGFMEPQTTESSLESMRYVLEYWVQFMQHNKGLDIYTGLHQCDSDSNP